MKPPEPGAKGSKRGRQSGGRTPDKAASAGERSRDRRRKGRSPIVSTEEPKRRYAAMTDALKFYKPIKKPVTLRLDADVIAWFKREGRRYQTRINRALRRVMEREMQAE